jgi:hypothetical protein
MCFGPEASFISAAVLVPAGALAMRRAYQMEIRYLPFATLPLLFGLQQFFEGLVWTGAMIGNRQWINGFSLAYMFFSWLAWPVWVPFSTYFLEPCRRRQLYLMLAIFGGMLGALQYIPYFAHDGWLNTIFYKRAISYEGIHLLDNIVGVQTTYLLYLIAIITPLVSSSLRNVNIFGYLVVAVLFVTYVFFQFAYISVFCFGGAIMSLFIIYIIFCVSAPLPSHHGGEQQRQARLLAEKW